MTLRQQLAYLSQTSGHPATTTEQPKFIDIAMVFSPFQLTEKVEMTMLVPPGKPCLLQKVQGGMWLNGFDWTVGADSLIFCHVVLTWDGLMDRFGLQVVKSQQ